MCSANSQAHLERAPHPIVRADSATKLPADSRGAVLVLGSHAAVHAVALAPGLAIFNDAGGAADGSGLDGIVMLGGLGTAAIAVSAANARIRSARSTLLDGIVSFVNAPAAARGVRAGEKAASVAARLLS